MSVDDLLQAFYRYFAASSSQITVTCGWNCKILPGTFGVTGPFTTSFRISALFSPFTRSTIFFARIIVPIPIETAFLGTSSFFSKKRLFASIVLSVRSISPVTFVNSSAGSLNPMTFLTSGTLGIPGVCLLYSITWYQFL